MTPGDDLLRRALLALDAAIVAEDERYLVLAVRLSKDTLRANHSLLMAISEHLTAMPDPPAAQNE